MKIAVIGAGVAGIVSLKYILEAGIKCDCFEETREFGGTWVYTTETGTDKNGMTIYRSMYQNLLTNIPKELMTFTNFPYPTHLNYSYITSEQVLQYISDYVHKFNLERYIQYSTTVTEVKPENSDKWSVTTLSLTTNEKNTRIYDQVFVCNGHFRFPKIPLICGQNIFQGTQIHSRDYRTPDLCKNKRVLIVGAGFSGIDISTQIVSCAKIVFLSHWTSIDKSIKQIVNKPSVVELQANNAIFKDGSSEDIDVVIYTTGYEYKFPFLSDSCKIVIEDNWVRPLYKHMINIEHPTMIFIGIPYLATTFILTEAQVQFAISMIKKEFVLPTKKEMEIELREYINSLIRKNKSLKHVHKFGFYQREYLLDLCQTAGFKAFPPVLSDLYDYLLKSMKLKHKSTRFTLLNDNVFVEDIL